MKFDVCNEEKNVGNWSIDYKFVQKFRWQKINFQFCAMKLRNFANIINARAVEMEFGCHDLACFGGYKRISMELKTNHLSLNSLTDSWDIDC